MGNVLVPKNEVKGVTTRGGRMMSEATPSKEDKDLMLLKSKSNDYEPWFRVPKALISDRGAHFCNSQLEKALQKYGVTHKLSTAYHPQTNGQTEVTNRTIKRILERSVGYNPNDWSEKLNDALWAFRTTYKTPTGCTPFRLAELRDGAYENTRIYKKQTKKWHDSRLRGDKDFKVGDKVLLYNSHPKMYPGKLKSKWSGPNIVKMVYPYGAVEITYRNGFNFKVNGQRLKKYYEDNIDEEDHEVIEFENGLNTAYPGDIAEKKSTMLVKYRSSGILCVLLYYIRRVQKFFGVSQERFLDEDLASLSCFFSDIEQNQACDWIRGNAYLYYVDVGSGLFSIMISMCCDDSFLVTPQVSALVGCDRLVSEPLVIEKQVKEKSPEKIPDVKLEEDSKKDLEEDPEEDSEEEEESKKKKQKEASKSGSNT
ncbi:reverse transcriptase domain-containing protein [Tanacetum coccineum]